MSRRSEEQDQARSRGRPKGLPKRWSTQRKAEVVLRLLRGENIGEVSREIRVAPPELERWRRVFLGGGQQGLKVPPAGDGVRVVAGRACERVRVAGTNAAGLWSPIADSRGSGAPKTELSDEELAKEIRTVLKANPFLGEGHRKVKVRLAAKGIRAGKNRVLRLMRAHGLLAPVRRGHPRGDRSHSGRIRTERPDELWGTDASRFWTRAEGWCWFLRAIVHCASDVVGWHVPKKGDRWAALEPVRRGHPGPHGRLRQGRSPGASACGMTGAHSTGPGSSRPRSSGSAPARRPPTWASRSATASQSASSGCSRRSASICTISRPSRR